MRLLLIFLGFALLVLIPFAIWGEQTTTFFTQTTTLSLLESYGYWAWVIGIVLLTLDLLLPLPATVIMAAIGMLYGPLLGGVINAIGSVLAGTLGYELCRQFGERTTRRLLGENDWQRGQKINHKIGGFIVALSRWTPLLPEVIACMAGMIRMERVKFYLALACGSVPLGFAYAMVGNISSGINSPLLTLAIAAIAPILLWLLLRPLINKYAS
ncbi:putative membrane protein YdjX (TVP38/TMEM64 family) [Catalinimonas alkaloidigena]|uniref:TVP38/TMEM64 family protein n=1 Tax=Catalinimonas alkaloidigena TaxID=1075417 RepID=UPI002405D7AE|nr:VTT domain-containing protein [Catalinimonas alkaloidigena]MDF9800440.1 putative membrane protein YdjX (TVP38/TMEM64 family) [Catalinimonas alkaloidigena]